MLFENLATLVDLDMDLVLCWFPFWALGASNLRCCTHFAFQLPKFEMFRKNVRSIWDGMISKKDMQNLLRVYNTRIVECIALTRCYRHLKIHGQIDVHEKKNSLIPSD